METDICWFFSRNGWCRYGNSCKYRHQRIFQSPSYYYANQNYNYYNVPYYPVFQPNPGHRHPNPHPRPQVRPQGWRRHVYNKNGAKGKSENKSTSDVHDDPAMETLCHQVSDLEVTPNNSNSPSQEPQEPIETEQLLDVDQVVIETQGPLQTEQQLVIETETNAVKDKDVIKETEKLSQNSRDTEVMQLKKRFPAHKVLDGESDCSFSLEVFATDPDWPFSVKNVHLIVNIPIQYPTEVLGISVPDDLNPTFPPTLTRHLNVSITNWIQDIHQRNVSSGKSELLFRPFLKWFDRNLVDLFTNGLRKTKLDMNASAVGLEFVPYENLLPTGTESDSEKVDVTRPESQPEFSTCLEAVDVGQDSVVSADSSQRGQRTQYSSTPKGTEMKFRVFEINENVGTMKCHTLAMTVQCCKCKSRHEITASPKRVNVVKCTKCSQQLKLVFRPCLMHQFNSVIGYLDLDVCRPFDLVLFNCSFLVDCIVCNKQITIDGVHYGQVRTNWCHNCNAKMTFKIEGVKFSTHRQASIAGKEHVIKLDKIAKQVRDPAIQEGKPLPDNGACKHYKKSFRWFRFPCCGKAYPCDLCHEEKETGHEMKFANRIICGFCANEQPYARERPCARCGSGLTKTSGSYWEGGKGCREKSKMSRDDKHKYSGINKTIPKKIIR